MVLLTQKLDQNPYWLVNNVQRAVTVLKIHLNQLHAQLALIVLFNPVHLNLVQLELIAWPMPPLLFLVLVALSIRIHQLSMLRHVFHVSVASIVH